MTEPTSHLSADDIDAYWRDRLSDADVEWVEHHYLACAACHDRVRAVEAAIASLRTPEVADERRPEVTVQSGSRRGWRIAAGLVTAASLLLGWEWATTRQRERALQARVAMLERLSSSSNQALPATSTSVTRFRLAPSTRDASAPVVLRSLGEVVLFDIDAREAGPPTARVDAVLKTEGGLSIVSATGLRPTADGIVTLPVNGALLPSGEYVIELRSGGTPIALPFSISSQE